MYSNFYACRNCAAVFARRPSKTSRDGDNCPVCGNPGKKGPSGKRRRWYEKIILDEPGVRG